MTARTIELHTRLDDGIYASQGGGENRVVRTWSVGPRNLLAAARELRAVRKANAQSYGNIGAGSSWLEVAGRVVDQHELDDMLIDDREDSGAYMPQSPTAKAAAYLQAWEAVDAPR